MLPSSLESIGEYAFYACARIIEVVNKSTLPVERGSTTCGFVAECAIRVGTDDVSLKRSGDFYYIADGEKAYLVKYVGNEDELVLPSSLDGKNYEIYRYAFSGTYVESVTVDDGVLGIWDYAFYGCTELKSVFLSDSVTFIGDYAFAFCTSLYEFEMGNGVLEIGSWTFKNCNILSSFKLSDSLKTIGSGAFEGCASILFLTIPASVDYIGNYAFYGCSAIESLYFEKPYGWHYLTSLLQYDDVLNNKALNLLSSAAMADSEKTASLFKGSYNGFYFVRFD